MPNNLNITNLPKFKYGTTARINSTAISNGSVLVDIERGLAYADLANSRISLGDVVRVSSASSLPTTAYNKLYLTEDTGDLYYKVNNTWRMLSASANINDRLAAIDDAIEALQEASGTVAAHSHVISDVTDLATQLAGKAPDNASVEYINDTRSAAGAAWTGVTKDAALYDGKTVIFRLAYNSSSNATLNLTLADGSTTGAKAIYFSSTARLGTQFVATNPVMLTYVAANDAWYVVNKYTDSNTAPTYLGGFYVGVASTNAIVANTVIACNKNQNKWETIRSGMVIDWSRPILYSRSAYASAAEVANADLFNAATASARSIPGMSASFAGFTKYNYVYLVGTYNETNNTFTVDTIPLTTTIPTTEDGKLYVSIGWASSTYQYRFVPEYPVFTFYKYYDGKFQKYVAGQTAQVKYVVSGSATTAANGEYTEDTTKMGVNGSTVYSNGNGYYLAYGTNDRGGTAWYIHTTVYAYEELDAVTASHSGGTPSTVPTGAWNYGGVTVTLDDGSAGDMKKSDYDTDGDGIVDQAAVAGFIEWDNVANKPDYFTPRTHSHAISDVTDLQTTLNGKANSTHSHGISDITNLQSTLNGKASSTHSHAISDITNLSSTLDGKLSIPSGGNTGDTIKKTVDGVEWSPIDKDIIEVTSLPAASSSTLGKLYRNTTNGKLYLGIEGQSSTTAYTITAYSGQKSSAVTPLLNVAFTLAGTYTASNNQTYEYYTASANGTTWYLSTIYYNGSTYIFLSTDAPSNFRFGFNSFNSSSGKTLADIESLNGSYVWSWEDDGDYGSHQFTWTKGTSTVAGYTFTELGATPSGGEGGSNIIICTTAAEMQAATTSDNVGKVCLYIGETDTNYTKGHHYAVVLSQGSVAELAELDSASATVTVDSALSTTSTNPVQNSVITNELNAIKSQLIIQKITVNCTTSGYSQLNGDYTYDAETDAYLKDTNTDSSGIRLKHFGPGETSCGMPPCSLEVSDLTTAHEWRFQDIVTGRTWGDQTLMRIHYHTTKNDVSQLFQQLTWYNTNYSSYVITISEAVTTPTVEAIYKVSGSTTSAVNGVYEYDPNHTGYNSSKVYTNGTYYLYYFYAEMYGTTHWVIASTVSASSDRAYEISGYVASIASNSATTPPSTGTWSEKNVTTSVIVVNELSLNAIDTRVTTLENAWSGLNITSVQLVTELPANPVATVLYLIEDTESSGSTYTVSGTSSANGTYTLESSLTGRNNSPVWSNGSGWYLAYGYDGDNEENIWVLTQTTPSSTLYFNQPPAYHVTSSDATEPPTTGWSAGMTIVKS